VEREEETEFIRLTARAVKKLICEQEFNFKLLQREEDSRLLARIGFIISSLRRMLWIAEGRNIERAVECMLRYTAQFIKYNIALHKKTRYVFCLVSLIQFAI
jgi:hypothetical protein